MNSILVCAGLFLIGSALHLSRTFWFADDRERARESSMGDALRLLAYQTQLAALLLLLAFVMGPFALVAAAIIVFALAESAWRHSIQERRTLAWIFAAASAQGVPLTEALTAFYSADDVGSTSKGARLISLLSLGMPLHLALQGAGIRLTPGLRLATAQGVALGALPERLARAINEEEDTDEDLQRLNQKIGYSATVFFTMCVVLYVAAGVMVMIAPVIEMMFVEFDIQMPPLALLAMAVSRYAVGSYFISPLFILVLVMAPVISIVVALHQFGIRLWDYPIINRLLPAFDRARLYRGLAVSFRRHESMLPVLDQLGIFFPRAYIRNRIRRARNRFVGGEDWLSALARERLIPRVDRRILESAEKSGNIAWSLEELATIRSRRQIQRLESIVTITNTLLVLFIGLVAFLYGSLIYMSVTKLIGELR